MAKSIKRQRQATKRINRASKKIRKAEAQGKGRDVVFQRPSGVVGKRLSSKEKAERRENKNIRQAYKRVHQAACNAKANEARLQRVEQRVAQIEEKRVTRSQTSQSE